MAQLLTESEAWALITSATLTDDPSMVHGDKLLVLSINEDIKFYSYGLCMAVDNMYDWNLITLDTYNAMNQRIDNRISECPNSELVTYIWDRTIAGHEQRLAFAAQMAEETKGTATND